MVNVSNHVIPGAKQRLVCLHARSMQDQLLLVKAILREIERVLDYENIPVWGKGGMSLKKLMRIDKDKFSRSHNL